MTTKRAENKYSCTGCRKKITSAFDAFLHPLLKCLVCRKCHTDYKTGDFSLFDDGVDENGDDNYCRWCVDGGDLYTCGNSEKPDPQKCHYSFCTDCIVRNCPDDEVLKADQMDKEWKWVCYACDHTKLKSLRLAAQEAIEYLSSRDLRRAGGAVVTTEKTVSSSNDALKPVDDAICLNPESDEAMSGTSKKRKLDSNSDSQVKDIKEKARDKDRNLEKDKERAREKDRDRHMEKEKSKEKDREKESEKDKVREKAKDKEASRDKDKEKDKDNVKDKEKDKDKDSEKNKDKIREKDKTREKEKDSFREPESYNRPPVEAPKPAKSILRTTKVHVVPLPKPHNLNQPVSNPSAPKPPTPSPNDSQPKPKTSEVPSNVNNDVTKSKIANNLNLQKSGRVSKQLKSSNEIIKPMVKIPLIDRDLKYRLENFEKVKDRCVKEIDTRFKTIFEMFTCKELENKTIIKCEIEDLEKPLNDFNTMLINLKSLYSSQY